MSNCYSNQVCSMQPVPWSIRIKTELTEEAEQSSSNMDFQESWDSTNANSKIKIEPDVTNVNYYYGESSQPINCMGNNSFFQSSLLLDNAVNDDLQRNKEACDSPYTDMRNYLTSQQSQTPHVSEKYHSLATNLSAAETSSALKMARSPSQRSSDEVERIIALRNERIRLQPQIRPEPADIARNINDFPPVSPPAQAWCHAYYYELNQRIGEPFKGGTSHVIVDGFCATSEAERFCLGALGNVNRNPGVVNARRQIGRGVRIFHRDGDVYAECLSEAPVFIQSPIYAFKAQDHPATVYKLQSGHEMQMFDTKSFDVLLEQTVPQGFHALYSLQRMCHMRISFVKGWGKLYKRQTITSTPCWVEIHLVLPLQKLDRMLSAVPGPDDPIHSFT